MKSGVLKAIEAAAMHPGAVDGLDLHRRKTVGNLIGCHRGTLGAKVKRCQDCGKGCCIPHSCRNRSCPRCQAGASLDWLERQRASLLDAPYFHDVFTLPHLLNPVIRQNRGKCLGLLFDSASATLSAFAARELEAKIGVSAVLHTWGQTLCEHYHLHCIVTGGGVSLDGEKWIGVSGRRMFDVRALSAMFRGKYLAGLEALYESGELEFHGQARRHGQPSAFQSLLNDAARRKWVVYSKRPFAGPDQVLKYLSLYTHRAGIADGRILEVSQRRMKMRFLYRDYADNGRRKRMRLDLPEFLRRFCLHILPPRFVKIRHYGILSNRRRKSQTELARALIGRIRPAKPGSEPEACEEKAEPAASEPRCPRCGSFALEELGTLKSGSCIHPPVSYASGSG